MASMVLASMVLASMVLASMVLEVQALMFSKPFPKGLYHFGQPDGVKTLQSSSPFPDQDR